MSSRSSAETPPTELTNWSPTAAEMMLAMLAIFGDSLTGCADGALLHGSPSRGKVVQIALLDAAIKLYKAGKINKIVLNGGTRQQCEEANICYLGYEEWADYLVRNQVSGDDILLIPFTKHTAAETTAFFEMARGMGWEKLYVASQPHHQLRVFLQAVEIMRVMGFWPTVHNFTHAEVPLDAELMKPVLGTTDVINGTYETHIGEEFARVVKYAQLPPQEGAYTPHATIPQMLDYVRRRNAATRG